MIIVKVWGGIGNQLFQYVFGQYLHHKSGQDVYYDDGAYISNDKLRNSELNAIDATIVFKNECIFSRYRGVKNRLLKFFFQLHPYHHLVSEGQGAITEVYNPSHLYFFQGYWQDFKYYKWLMDNVPSFKLQLKAMPSELEEIQGLIRKSCSSVSIHIRRGDYFTPKYVKLYGVCDATYYEKALDYLITKNPELNVFVFTDDIEWVKKNIHFKVPYTIVPNYDVSQFAYIELMSKCTHHIISNSSFSWWGAVINESENAIVISPSKWKLNTYKTIALEKWIKM